MSAAVFDDVLSLVILAVLVALIETGEGRIEIRSPTEMPLDGFPTMTSRPTPSGVAICTFSRTGPEASPKSTTGPGLELVGVEALHVAAQPWDTDQTDSHRDRKEQNHVATEGKE